MGMPNKMPGICQLSDIYEECQFRIDQTSPLGLSPEFHGVEFPCSQSTISGPGLALRA
jgi:hypothetical protein